MSKVKVRNWLSSLLALVLIASSLYFPISKVSAEEVKILWAKMDIPHD